MLDKERLTQKPKSSDNSSQKISEVRLYGAGGHSQVIKETLGCEGIAVHEYFDDNPKRKHHLVPKVHKGVRQDIDSFPHQGPPFIISVGNNRERLEISQMLRSSFYTAIHDTAIVSPKAIIGEGTVIFAGAIIQPNTSVGKHVIINTGASIDHDNIIGDYAHISPQAALCGHVEIGEGTHVGVSACVIPKVKIGKWCTIGAGAVVIKDVPDYCTVVGNPGKIIKAKKPYRSNKHNDIAFVGSGISTSFTIIKLLDLYKNKKHPLKLSIIEKSNEFHTGIPYGYRSTDTSLLIKPLSQFLPSAELNYFIEWLTLNKKELVENALLQGGTLTQEWYENNREAIEKDDWLELYIPRGFFGKYISQVVEKKIRSAINQGTLSIDYITDEVVSIDKSSGNYTINLKNNFSSVVSKKVVLATGAAPNRKLFSTNDLLVGKDNGIMIEDPYAPSLKIILNEIKSFIDKKQKRKINILVIGTNASGIELVYKLNDDPTIKSKINHFYALSTQGKFPDAKMDVDPSVTFTPTHLIKLTKEKKITASDIEKAAKKDLDYADQHNISSIYTIQPISEVFCSLLDELSASEKRKFATQIGNEIGKRQREAGSHYSKVIRDLHAQERLTNLSGKFSGILSSTTNGLQFAYETKKKVIHHNQPVDVIINCSGGSDITDPKNENTLLRTLSKNNICQINDSNRGITVNTSLEASEGFYIIGPLLGGNLIDNKPIWHVEHAGRISSLSYKLATIIHEELSNKERHQENLIKV
ncbi:NeuD/PglB/VioB family sugar acetyltransferase [Aquimarina mytili]|uniref:NeuD/PglB/VioB family sugar acetyltransferase n=1 Tax=Aquimarina mytili TaxID=874423 RepID=A0A936ZX44_9FLAO|nr:NeuD/PglB/VioB family sugar acetyltransferase [Aquimarina mytili]MBL0685927.1 NeuD/PglB/VioB family sugar acetyltransferase [Aquimarina mytili]